MATAAPIKLEPLEKNILLKIRNARNATGNYLKIRAQIVLAAAKNTPTTKSNINTGSKNIASPLGEIGFTNITNSGNSSIPTSDHPRTKNCSI